VHHHFHHFVFETASPHHAERGDGRPAPVAEIAPEPPSVAEPGEDAELAEMLRLEPAPVITDEPEPAPVITDERAPAPVAIDATPSPPPRNALEADLFARLAAARAKNAPATGKDTGKPEGGSADSAVAPGGVSTN
jgi:hypothetical protein